MKSILLAGFLGTLLCLGAVQANPAGESGKPTGPPVVKLWPTGKMPGPAPAGTERELPSRGDNVIRLTDVHEPSITVFHAPGAKAPVPAVIVCPGGGYNALAWNKEGTEVAAWLNTLGITGIVLKYRVPGQRDGAFQDLQRAMRLVRQQASTWNLAPDRIGVMGFSAGGHLCARLGNQAEPAPYPKLDGGDEQKGAPDFVVLVYPAYLAGKNGSPAPELPVSARTPPTFLVHTADDKSHVPGSRIYHAALEAAGVPNAFFLPATGGHGYGLRATGEIAAWPDKCRDWLNQQGFLGSATKIQ